MLEFRVLECWSFEWTFGVGGSSLRERVDPLLGGSPYAGFRENRRVVTLGLDRLLDWLSVPGGLDFWRWLIRKPFRLGLVDGLPLPG
jgi:hypothetical protein